MSRHVKRLEEDALVETALQFYAAAVAGICAPRGLERKRWRRLYPPRPMCKRLEEDALVETALQFYAAAVAGNCAPRGLSYGWIGRVGQGKGGGPAAMGGLDGEEGGRVVAPRLWAD